MRLSARSSRWVWPGVILASGIACGLLFFLEIDSSLRVLLTFWFLLVCPGMAFIRLLQLKKIYQEWTLAIALSIALDGLIASLLIYTHHWSVAAGLIILILLSAAGALLQVRLPGPQPIEA